MSVEELEKVISELPPAEMARFVQWFDQYRTEQWDKQIEADIKAGRLDIAGQCADADFEAGRCTPL